LTRDTRGLTYHGVTQSSTDQRTPGGPGVPPSASPSSDDNNAKKERVLHTRVPAVLERELKRFADNLRIPVSNLVRAILEDALNVADLAGTGIEERLKSAAKTLEHERERLKQRVKGDPLVGVVAFQPITLAQPAACAKCREALGRGARAHLGVTDGSYRGPNLIVCQACLPTA
jgi:hypothetical protein